MDITLKVSKVETDSAYNCLLTFGLEMQVVIMSSQLTIFMLEILHINSHSTSPDGGLHVFVLAFNP